MSQDLENVTPQSINASLSRNSTPFLFTVLAVMCIFIFTIVYAGFFFYFLIYIFHYDYAVYILCGYSIVDILSLTYKIYGDNSYWFLLVYILVKVAGIVLVLAVPEITPEMYAFFIYSVSIGFVSEKSIRN
jgi:hypothetical protein